MLIGDGGTADDEASNYALTGSNEVVLKQIMGQTKVNETYRTLLVKERVNLLDAASYKDKVQLYEEILKDEIKQLNPNLLIPLGEVGFNYLTGLNGIRKFRGSILTSNFVGQNGTVVKVLPILGPQPYLNQNYADRWVSRIDFAKAPRHANDSEPPEKGFRVWIAESSSALRAFLERSFKEDGLLVFDIETFMGIPTCISFCFDGIESVCIPFMDKSIDIDMRILMVQMVAKVLASPIRKVNQNIKYDWKCLERFGFRVNNVVGDTMLAASVLTPEFPKNLGFLTSIYTDIPYFKDEGREFDPSKHKKEQYYLYNAKDSLSVQQIHRGQLDEIRETNQEYVYTSLVKLIPLYRSMEDNGFRIDDTRRLVLLAKYESLYKIEVLKLQRLANGNVNPQSPKQMTELIYNVLGFEKGRYAKDTGEESLEHLMAFGNAKHSPVFGKQMLAMIINCRKIHKVIEYLNTLPYPDGNWRCEYNLSGTETGRSTAGKSTDQLITIERSESKGILKTKVEIERLGRSFQTIGKHGFKIDGITYGKDLRSIIVPRRGYSFVEVDLSQAEARVDAVLSGNFDILSVFDGPIGIHRLTGSWVFGCEPLEIKKNMEEYHISKTVRHAGERNMKADRLVMMIQKPLPFCASVLKKFHDMQPEIRQVFHHEIEWAIKQEGPLHRTLVAPNGRRRQFLGRIDAHLINEAISQLPQCIVSDQTKFSLIPTFEQCGDYAYLINEAHDGTLAEVKKGREMEYISTYKKNIEIPIDFNKCSLRRDFNLVIPAEASISEESWYDLKEVEG